MLVYFFVDPYKLQPVALASAVSQVVFFLLQRPPVLIFAFWDFLQACINATQVAKLFFYDQTPVLFSEREVLALSLTQRCFDAVPSAKIAAVLRRCGAAWRAVAPGASVVAFDDDGETDWLCLVVEGAVDVTNGDGDVVFRALPGSFVGETSLSHAVAGTSPCRETLDVPEVAAATADVDAGATVLAWPVARLARALARDATLLAAFREAIAIDLYAKMEREESLARLDPQTVVATDSSRGRQRPEAGRAGGKRAALRAAVRRLFFFPRGSSKRPRTAAAAPPTRETRAGSFRLRRRDSLEAVVGFIRGGGDPGERESLYRATVPRGDREATARPARDRRSEARACHLRYFLVIFWICLSYFSERYL